MNSSDRLTLSLASVAIIAVCVLIYGLFIYNNSQNIKRDQFYAEHCKVVNKQTNLYGSYTYNCGAK